MKNSANIEPLKLKEIEGKLQLAKTNLEMSKMLLERGFIRGAVDLGYNAAELCARALILLKQDDLPSRHRGIVQKFSEFYIKDGPLDKETGRQLNKGLDYRNSARYIPTAKVTKNQALHNTDLAEKLIGFLEKGLQ